MKKKKNKIEEASGLGLKTVIVPGGKNLQYWKDIWKYRPLAMNLAKRDITVRYKQTVIGLGWSVISPVFNMLLMTFVFGSVAKMPSDGTAPYAVMVYAGLIPWTLFSKTFNTTSYAFLSGAGIMKKIYFPRIISPLGATLATVIDSLISFVIMLVIILITHFTSGFTPSWHIVFAPLFFVFPILLGFFTGLFISPGSIRYRDINQILPFALTAHSILRRLRILSRKRAMLCRRSCADCILSIPLLARSICSAGASFRIMRSTGLPSGRCWFVSLFLSRSALFRSARAKEHLLTWFKGECKNG